MTKVKIDPGVCGMITSVTAQSDDGMDVNIKIESMCPSIMKMAESLGEDFDAYELCLAKPGGNIFYDYARENMPAHAACPTIAGIIKAVEVECNLALPKNVVIEIEKG